MKNIKNNIKIEATNLSIKFSVQKLNLVVNHIRNKNVYIAKLHLDFCNKAAAYYIKSILISAVANSQHNFNLNVNNLFIQEIKISRISFLKRHRIRAKGKINKILKPISKITIILSTNITWDKK